MSILAGFMFAMLIVAIACPTGWVILSRWLGGRSLIIATIASAVSVGIARSSYSGPIDDAALTALAGLAGSLLAGFILAKIWLARAAKDNGLIDG